MMSDFRTSKVPHFVDKNGFIRWSSDDNNKQTQTYREESKNFLCDNALQSESIDGNVQTTVVLRNLYAIYGGGAAVVVVKCFIFPGATFFVVTMIKL